MASGQPATSTAECFLDRQLLIPTQITMAPEVRQRTRLATLHVRSGRASPSALEVWGPVASVGSAPENDIALAQADLAPSHGQLRLRGGVWTFADGGSRAGSWVDGEPVLGDAVLAPGSTLRLGGVTLAFAPDDTWQDSPPRLPENRLPFMVLPEADRTVWPTLLFIGVLCGVIAAAVIFLRAG